MEYTRCIKLKVKSLVHSKKYLITSERRDSKNWDEFNVGQIKEWKAKKI